MTTLNLDLAEVTFARIERVCLLLRLKPHEVLDTQVKVEFKITDEGRDVLAALIEDPEALPEGSEQLVRRTAVVAVREYLGAARRHVYRAHRKSKHYAEWTGIQPLLEATGGGDPTELELVLVRLPADEYFALRRAPLEEMLAYLMVRTVDFVAEHPTHFIPGYAEA